MRGQERPLFIIDFSVARDGSPRAKISIIPYPQHFVKQNLQKKYTKILPKICAFCILQNQKFFAIIIYVKR